MTFENPYPGLRSFEFDESHLFFGRDDQSGELVRRLQRSHFIAVVGTSGSGKSSLVRAGLLPFLYTGLMSNAGSRWRVSLFRPGNQPIRALADSLVYLEEFAAEAVGDTKTPFDLADEEKVKVVEKILRRSEVGLLDFMNGNDFAPEENLLVVVDQFEELFRFKEITADGAEFAAEETGGNNFDEKAAFVKLLLTATREKTSRVYVVLTMRSDYLGDCARFRDLPEKINNGQYLIPRLTRDQLHEAIVTPAERSRARAVMSPLLVNRLLNDIENKQDQLPILQHALMRTWDNWQANQKNGSPPSAEITLAHYQNIGGMDEALSKHANEAYDDLANKNQLQLLDEAGKKIPSPRQKVAEKMFKCLTDTDPNNRETRRETMLGEICAVTQAGFSEVKTVIEVFSQPGRTFLTVSPPDKPLSAESIIDITHESLIRNWEKLGEWVKEEANAQRQYRRIVEDASDYQRLGNDALWRGAILAEAIQWRDDFNPNSAWAARYLILTDKEKARLDELRQESPTAANRLLREINESRFAMAMAFLTKSGENEIDEVNAERARANELAQLAGRLKLAVRALAVLLLAAMSLAGYSYYQYKQLSYNQGELTESKRKLQGTNDELLLSEQQLVEKNDLLIDQRKELLNSYKELDEEKQKTEALYEKAESERAKAEKGEAEKAILLENQRELTQTAIEAKNLAEKNEGIAKKAKSDAERNAAQEKMTKDGLTFFAENNYVGAKDKFVELSVSYKTSQENTADVKSKDEGEWWVNHNLGEINWKAEAFADAMVNYDDALKALCRLDDPQTNCETRRQNVVHTSYRSSDSKRAATLKKFAEFSREFADFTLNNPEGRVFLGQNRPRLRLILDEEFSAVALNKYAAEKYKEFIEIKQNEPVGEDSERKRARNTVVAQAESKLAQTYLDLKNSADAATHFNKAAKMYESIGKIPVAIKILTDASRLFMLNNELTGAENLLHAAVAYRQKELSSQGTPEISQLYDSTLGSIYSDLGVIYLRLYDERGKNYQKEVEDRKERSKGKLSPEFIASLYKSSTFTAPPSSIEVNSEEQRIIREFTPLWLEKEEAVRKYTDYSDLSYAIKNFNSDKPSEVSYRFDRFLALAEAYSSANKCPEAQEIISRGIEQTRKIHQAFPAKTLTAFTDFLLRAADYYARTETEADSKAAEKFYDEWIKEFENVQNNNLYNQQPVNDRLDDFNSYLTVGTYFLRRGNYAKARQVFDKYSLILKKYRNQVKDTRDENPYSYNKKDLDNLEFTLQFYTERTFEYENKPLADSIKAYEELLSKIPPSEEKAEPSGSLFDDEYYKDETYETYIRIRLADLYLRTGKRDDAQKTINEKVLKFISSTGIGDSFPAVVEGNISGLKNLAESNIGGNGEKFYEKALDLIRDGKKSLWYRQGMSNGLYFRPGGFTEKFYTDYIESLEGLINLRKNDESLAKELETVKKEAETARTTKNGNQPKRCGKPVAPDDYWR